VRADGRRIDARGSFIEAIASAERIEIQSREVMAMLLTPDAPRVLAIGAHPNDVELGAGGFIHRLATRCGATVHYLILTAGVQGLPNRSPTAALERRAEAHNAADLLQTQPRINVELLSYPDCQLHECGHELIREIEKRLYDEQGGCAFDAILTHAAEDTHADHRAAHEATLSAVRDFHGTVLMYQAPSTKPNGFRPTFFVKLEQEDIDQKNLAIMAHVSQRHRSYMTVSRAGGMADNWSIFLRQPKGTYLEAFEVYKSYF
jgi:LmbE family N-acetylglucosaminyl deacetylase